MKSVAIIDGFAEGSWHSKLLKQDLSNAGYKITDKVEQADIILAHSAGCFFLPSDTSKMLVVLIGPPHWPGKPLILSFVQKVWYDLRAHIKDHRLVYWFKKSVWNILYSLTDLARVFYISTYTRKRRLPEIIKSHNVHLIRNEKDAWCSPEIAILLGIDKSRYHEFKGEHDDCWTNTSPYIKLLHSLE